MNDGQAGLATAASHGHELPRPLQARHTAALSRWKLLALLEQELGHGHRCREIEPGERWPEGRVEVRGALMYGNREHVRVRIARDGNMYRVSDDGGALRRAALRTEGHGASRTQRYFADCVARAWRVQLEDDEVHATGVWLDDLPVYVQQVLVASWEVERSV